MAATVYLVYSQSSEAGLGPRSGLADCGLERTAQSARILDEPRSCETQAPPAVNVRGRTYPTTASSESSAPTDDGDVRSAERIAPGVAGIDEDRAVQHARERRAGSRRRDRCASAEPVVEVDDRRVVADDLVFVHAAHEADGVGAEVESQRLRAVARRAEAAAGLCASPHAAAPAILAAITPCRGTTGR